MKNYKNFNFKKLQNPACLLPLYAVAGIVGLRLLGASGTGYLCPFRKFLGIYCPGCGGTRALSALLSGDLSLSVHENPAILILGILFLLYYCEILFRELSGKSKSVRILPRHPVFWGSLLAVWMIWNILRNLIPALMPYT